MNKIQVTTKEQLDELYNSSALTLIGLSEDSISDFINWIIQYTPLKNENVYITKGKVMNDNYNLTGDNSYDPDLNIVSVKLCDMENSSAIILPKFEIGGRWFDDIVDNNARREQEKCR